MGQIRLWLWAWREPARTGDEQGYAGEEVALPPHTAVLSSRLRTPPPRRFHNSTPLLFLLSLPRRSCRARADTYSTHVWELKDEDGKRLVQYAGAAVRGRDRKRCWLQGYKNPG